MNNFISLNFINPENQINHNLVVNNLTIIAGEDSDHNAQMLGNIWHQLKQNNHHAHLINADRQMAFLSPQPHNINIVGQDNFEFIQSLTPDVRLSEFANNNLDIINQLELIMGGSLSFVAVQGNVFHKSLPNNQTKELPLHLSSPMVRNLAYIYLYVKHALKSGDILLIEEPELSMHPRFQVQMARVINMLVNAGVRLVITTHSDYMIREFNALIALGSMSTLPTEEQKSKYTVFENINNDMMVHYGKVNLYGLTNGNLSDKLTVNANGLNLYTFNNIRTQQEQLFTATNNFLYYDRNKEGQ